MSEAAELSCPICLISSDDTVETPGPTEAQDNVKFLKTPCDHVFCQSCIERVLLKPRQDSIPTRAPCPMCREPLNLFDLCHAANNGAEASSLVYAGETDVASWGSIANSQFKQRTLIPMQNPGNLLQKVIDEKGALQGFGIKFCFGPIPSMEFAKPLAVVSEDGLLPLNSIEFDASHFHQKSMTFHGTLSAFNPLCNSSTESYCYEELSCLLHFSDNGNYIRQGNLRWKFAPTPFHQSSPLLKSYPLDGTWEVQFGGGHSTKIFVQRHFFSCFNSDYTIDIDKDNHRPRFLWPIGSVEQTSNQQILPGTSGPGVGESLEWTTNAPGQEQIVWKRLTVNLNDCWRSVDIIPGVFVYRNCNQQPGNDQSLGPSYQATTIWGNTFCQGFSVGMASYHFEEPDSNGNFQAYISYESPRTEMWPSLDNGETVPSRVPFRNIHWESETRTFKGDICWEQDFGTTWMNESKWSYEIQFDPAFLFVAGGTCSRSEGESHQFGIDLIYINAAIETLLRETLQTAQSTEAYFDFVNQCRDTNASASTVQMVGAIAMAVMGDQESMIDFNL